MSARKRHFKLERLVTESQLRSTYAEQENADQCLATLRTHHVFPEIEGADFSAGKESSFTFGNPMFSLLHTLGFYVYFRGSMNVNGNGGSTLLNVSGMLNARTSISRNICELVSKELGMKFVSAFGVKDVYNDKGDVIGRFQDGNVRFLENSVQRSLIPDHPYAASVIAESTIRMAATTRPKNKVFCNPVLIPELGIYGFMNIDKQNHLQFGENGAYYLRLLHLMGFHTASAEPGNGNKRTKGRLGSDLPAYVTGSISKFDQYDTRSQRFIRMMLRDMLIVLSDSRGSESSIGVYLVHLLGQPDEATMHERGKTFIDAINIAYPGIGFSLEKNFRRHEISKGVYHGVINLNTQDLIRLREYDSPFVTLRGSGPANPSVIAYVLPKNGNKKSPDRTI